VGKHNRSTDWENQSAQQKAEEFDKQFDESVARANEKRENNDYPYDLDGIVGQ